MCSFKKYLYMFFSIITLQAGEINFGLSNDAYGMKFLNPSDDRRTASVYLNYVQNEGSSVYSHYSILTDRDRVRRMDEAGILFRYRKAITFLNQEYVLTPGAGLYITGELGGDRVQNDLHSTLGIYSVEGLYDSGPLEFHPAATLGLSHLFFSFEPIEDLKIEISADLNFLYAVNMSMNFDRSLALVFSGEGFSFQGGTGYMVNRSFSSSSTIRQVQDTEDQGRLHFSVKAAFFEYGLNLYMDSRYSSGHFYVNLHRDPVKKRFIQEDVIVGAGTELDPDDLHYIRSFLIGIKPFKGSAEKTGFLVKSVYDLALPDLLNPSDSELFPGKTDFNRIVISAFTELLPEKWFFTPYLAAGGGLEKYMYSESSGVMIPVAEGEAGLKIRLPFCVDNSQPGISFSAVKRRSFGDISLRGDMRWQLFFTLGTDL